MALSCVQKAAKVINYVYRLNSHGRELPQTRRSNRFFFPFLGPQRTPCLIKAIKRQGYEEERGPSRNGVSLFVLLSWCSRGLSGISTRERQERTDER